MSNMFKVNHVKRTQKDYSLSFKLQVVSEIERGELSIKGSLRKYGIQSHGTVLNWIKKYGSFDRELKVKMMEKSPSQKLLELEIRVKQLEKEKKTLEQQLYFQTEKAILFDMMIDIAENELNIPVRKKSLTERLNAIKPKESDQ